MVFFGVFFYLFDDVIKIDQYKLINLISLHSSGCLLYKNTYLYGLYLLALRQDLKFTTACQHQKFSLRYKIWG